MNGAPSIFEITRKLLETAFKTYWAANVASVPLTFDNTPFAQPANSEWVRFTILPGAGVQASIGGAPREFQTGIVVVQIFTAKNTGTRRASVLADFVAKGLRYRQMQASGIVVDAEAPQGVPVGDRTDIYQTNVQVRFRAQHIAAVAA